MSTSLLVPIGLHALCVGKPDAAGGDKSTAEFARVAADFSSLPYLEGDNQNPRPVGSGPNLSQQALPTPFIQVKEPLKPGIHLHWTLPEALAHTHAGETGPAQPRLAPNRWLVARIAATTGTAPVSEIRAWIVESDLLWEGEDKHVESNKLSRSYPLAEPGPAGEVPNRAVQTIGRAFPYEGWSETADGEYSKPHTALGYSEITYAAAYAHSPNSFGFWDTLEDLDPKKFPAAETSASYLVAGWYSSLAEDPLSAAVPSGAGRAQALAAIEKQLSWTFPDDGKGSVPEASLCSGLLTGLSWEPDKAYLEGPPKAPVKVAIGNTTTEALGALLAEQPGLDGVEPVLNALELGVLDGLRSAEDEALENAEHEAGFGHETGGTLWIVKPTKKATPAAVPPAGVAPALDELNAAQGEAEALEARLEDERAQLFADWQKYMTLTYPSGSSPARTPSSEEAQEYIQSTVLVELKQLAAQALAAAGKAKDKLSALEKALGGSADWEVGSISASRYWAAHEPVALLSGAGLDAVYRPSLPQSTDKSGNLQCRLSTTVLSALAVSGQQKVTATDLPALPASPNRAHAAELAALTAEAFFADLQRAALLAAAAKGAASQQEIEAAQKGGTTGKVGFAGQWPAPAGLLEWEQPWIPLHMQWELEYHPLSGEGDYDPGFLLANFALEPDGVELVDDSPPPSPPSPAEKYRGIAVLARSGPASLVPQIKNYLHNHPGDPNAALLEKVAAELEGTLGRQLLAQRLSGFNAALRMRMQTLQLPVRDPLAIATSKVLDTFSNTRVREAVGGENRTAPLPENAFSPLRAGFARIARLRVIDVFGQKLDLAPQPTEVIRSRRLIPHGDNPSDPYLGLPPRFAQPGRLSFRLLSATDDEVEMNSDPATSPIFGWVLFNHVEDSLAIYDAAGTALGSLDVLGPRWTGAPGNDATFDKTPEEALEHANPHLRDFVLGIYNHPEPVAFLEELLKTIDVATETIEPLSSSQSQALSVLIGRPLALVRAGVDLELRGLPALNQSWDSFTAAVNGSLPIAKRDCAKFPQLEVPVHLGKLANLEDGLVGYFATDAQQPYETFFAAAGKGTHVTPPPPGTLRVAAAGERTHVSLLVDPRCGVHASCGMMPAKQVELPLSLTAPALKAIAVTFLAAPVLSSAARLSMPAPEEPGRAWSWVSAGSASWSEGAIATPDAGAADLSRQKLSEGWLKLEESE